MLNGMDVGGVVIPAKKQEISSPLILCHQSQEVRL